MDELQLIQSKIYEIRGQKVMLDFDPAEMYEVETRSLNQAVKRNKMCIRDSYSIVSELNWKKKTRLTFSKSGHTCFNTVQTRL